MLIVDTSVVAELMRPAPDRGVARWLDRQSLDDLAITAVSVGEILYGLDLLPDGRRKADLARRFALVLERAFPDGTLPFDDEAAAVCAKIRAERRRAGRPVGLAEAMIAAIARSRRASLATRNLADFVAGCGIVAVDPWTA